MVTEILSSFHDGWIIGDFCPSLLRTTLFELGLKQHTRSEVIEPHVHRRATEYNILAYGRMEVNGHCLEKGAVFVLEKGEVVRACVLSEEAGVVCLKVPSVPGDKELLR
jgi:hypothetical protein